MHNHNFILFDLDGTLTDPGEGIINSLQYSLDRYGIKGDREILKQFIGPPLMDSFQKYFDFDEEKAQEAIAIYREYFAEKGVFENEIYPGIAELLKILQDQGKKLAVATTKPTVFAHQVLKYFSIDSYFKEELVIGSFLDGTRTDKSEIIGTVLELVDSSNLSKVMVGDRKFDVLGAKAHGIPAIGVLYGYGSTDELETAGATVIAQTVADLQRLLTDK